MASQPIWKNLETRYQKFYEATYGKTPESDDFERKSIFAKTISLKTTQAAYTDISIANTEYAQEFGFKFNPDRDKDNKPDAQEFAEFISSEEGLNYFNGLERINKSAAKELESQTLKETQEVENKITKSIDDSAKQLVNTDPKTTTLNESLDNSMDTILEHQKEITQIKNQGAIKLNSLTNLLGEKGIKEALKN
jgi:hypothetical protein